MKLFETEILCYSEIENLIDYYVDEEGNEIEDYKDGDDYYDVVYRDPYCWLLVNPDYYSEVKNMNLPMVEYEGSLWIGKDFGGTGWRDTSYWKVFE